MSTALPPEQEAIAQRTAALVVAFRSPILTRDEAIAYTKHESDSPFDRWCTTYGVKPSTRGRYARRWLDRALEREAAKGHSRRKKAA